MVFVFLKKTNQILIQSISIVFSTFQETDIFLK